MLIIIGVAGMGFVSGMAMDAGHWVWDNVVEARVNDIQRKIMIKKANKQKNNIIDFKEVKKRKGA